MKPVTTINKSSSCCIADTGCMWAKIISNPRIEQQFMDSSTNDFLEASDRDCTTHSNTDCLEIWTARILGIIKRLVANCDLKRVVDGFCHEAFPRIYIASHEMLCLLHKKCRDAMRGQNPSPTNGRTSSVICC